MCGFLVIEVLVVFVICAGKFACFVVFVICCVAQNHRVTFENFLCAGKFTFVVLI